MVIDNLLYLQFNLTILNQEVSHFGILLSNVVDKWALINTILSSENKDALRHFNHQKGILFSDLTIAQIIEREHKHDTIEISKSRNRQLQTFSSGERRQVLLDHCLAQQPDYIILDNPFDHLDQPSRTNLKNRLIELSNIVSMIQLSNKEDHFLPFITNKGYIGDNSLHISNLPDLPAFLGTGMLTQFPETLLTYTHTYDYIVRFKNVSIDYNDKPVVTNITWDIKPSEFWQLIGPNGSGKSTLLSLITGDNPKAYNQNLIIFDRKKGSGESIWDIKKNIGQFSTHLAELFQRNHTVEQMVLSGFYDSVGLYRQPSRLQQQKAMQWLNVINMAHLKTAYFNRLPLGQQRLVLLIRALIKQPPLLILDEPFEGLDAANTHLVVQLLNLIIEQTDITVIYVSHTIEKHMAPSSIYELIPTKDGSIGQIKLHF